MVFTYLKEKATHYGEHHPCMVGRFLALMAGLSNACIVISVKLISHSIHFTSISSIQVMSGLFLTFFIYMGKGKGSPFPQKPNLQRALLYRGLSGSLIFVGFNLGAKLLPSSKFMVINNTQSIWMVILGPFFIKEYPNRLIVSMVLISFIGIIILIDPSIIIPSSFLPENSQPGNNKKVDSLLYYLFPVTTSIGGAGVNMFLKAYSKEITSYQNAYYFLIFVAFYSGFLSSQLRDVSFAQPGIFDYVMMLLSGFFMVGYQFFLALAMKFETRASIVSVLLNSQILFTCILDVFILGSDLEVTSIIGGLIIIVCAVIITFTKESLSQNNETTPPGLSPNENVGEGHGVLEMKDRIVEKGEKERVVC